MTRTAAVDRAYNTSDLERLAAFLMACRAVAPEADIYHPGDLFWQFRLMDDPASAIRLWEEADVDGALLGFALADLASGALWLQFHPEADDTLAETALGWALDRFRHSGEVAPGQEEIAIEVGEDNAARIALLRAHGFSPLQQGHFELWRPLDRLIPRPALPAGFSLRHLTGPEEIDAYVAMHRDAWSRRRPSSYSAAAHRRLARTPGYRWELHPVVVAPDGVFASSCICWLDPVNGIGEIEPLGTRPAYERRGLARAVVAEALRLMRAHGMSTALVVGAESNPPALTLYASLGFSPGRRTLDFVRPR